MSHVNTEARLLAAIAASTDLDEQGRLMARLEQHRAAVRSQREAEREIDFAAPIVEAAFTPVRTFERHSHETDWLASTAAGTAADETEAVRIAKAEAILWTEGLLDAVKADRHEFREQAKGKAMQVAASFGPHREAAIEAFMREAVMIDDEEHDYNGYVIEINEHVDPEFDGDGNWAVIKKVDEQGYGDIVHETDEVEYPEDALDDAKAWIDSKTASARTAGTDALSDFIEGQRGDLDVEVIYTDGDAAAVSPDGEGVYWYDSVEEAEEDFGDIPVKRVSSRRQAADRGARKQAGFSEELDAKVDAINAVLQSKYGLGPFSFAALRRYAVYYSNGYLPSEHDLMEANWDGHGFGSSDGNNVLHGAHPEEYARYVADDPLIAIEQDRLMAQFASKASTNRKRKEQPMDRESRLRHLLAADFPQRDAPSDDLVPGTMPSRNPDGPPASDEDADQSGHAQSGNGSDPHVDPLDDNRGNRPAFPEQFDGGEEATVNEVTSRRRTAGTEVEVHDQTKRQCDICRSATAFYDGKTVMGPWANMCSHCFGQYGVGLGTGRGQKLIYVNASRGRPGPTRARRAHRARADQRRQADTYATQECPRCGKTNAASANRCGKGGSGGCGAVLPTDEKWASRRRQAMPFKWEDGRRRGWEPPVENPTTTFEKWQGWYGNYSSAPTKDVPILSGNGPGSCTFCGAGPEHMEDTSGPWHVGRTCTRCGGSDGFGLGD